MTAISSLPRGDVHVNAQDRLGPFEPWRCALSHGGINTTPLPTRVREGIAQLRPRLIRIFLQEHFAIYPERSRFDWTRLDPFMDALADTGAKLVACITIKPPVLFPTVDHAIWRPTSVSEWQQVISQLVKRYSVDRPLVSYWEVGNETDIGEGGGCPFLIPDPKDYFEFYRTTIKPILEAFPAAKVGGPASCWVENEPLPGLVQLCRETGVQLDFVSWHLYHDDPRRHTAGVEKAKALLAGFPGKRPEMLVTEWSKSFDPVSSQDLAFLPRRAATIAACLLAMHEAGLDWSFYYHIWDQVFYPEPFASFFSSDGIAMMVRHWNELPHRFGMFGVGEEVRPHYFLYQMLARLGDERLAASSDDADLWVLAARSDRQLSALLVNFDPRCSRDLVATVHLSGLQPGRKLVTLFRLDRDRRWRVGRLELLPVERREVYAPASFLRQLYSPADSIALLTLTDLA